jgi:hypothetical protein
MKAILCNVIFVALLILAAGQADARWWEFGRADDEPVVTELMFNQVDVAYAEDVVVLSREDLGAGGMLIVRGRADVGRGLIGLVEVSLDGGETWQRATLGDRGRFTFELRPELERQYAFRVRAITTVGKMSDEQEHSFTLRVTTADLQEEVRQAFLALLRAYMEENRSAFMDGVSRDFEGNLSALEDAVTDDFRYLDNIRIEPQISRVGRFGQSHEVYFTFNRRVQSSRTGQILSDAAASMAGFVREGEGFRLTRLAAPLIFGLSGGEDVATSVTMESVDKPVITLDPVTGAVDAVPLDEMLDEMLPGHAAAVTGSATLTAGHPFSHVFEFDGGNVSGLEHWGTPQIDVGDFLVLYDGHNLRIFLRNGNQAQRLHTPFDATTQVPAAGYTSGPFQIAANQVYAFSLLGGQWFGLLEITSITSHVHDAYNIHIRYKFQPDGSRNF